MHEWALAESVVATIEKEMQQHRGASLHSVTLIFGELQNIDREIFQTGIQEMLPEIRNKGDGLRIETESARFSCNACGTEWSLQEASDLSEDQREAIHFLPEAAHAFLSCPHCGSPDYQVIAGRGVTLASIELLEPEGAE